MIRVQDIPVVCRVVTLVVDMAVARSRLVLLVTLRPVLCFLRLSVGHAALVVDIGSGVCALVLLVTLRPVLCFLRLSVGHAALVVDIGSGMCALVLLVTLRPVLCSLRLSVGHAALVVDIGSGMFYAGFAGNVTLCAVFPSIVGWPCRARRRHWQWNVLCWFCWSRYLLCCVPFDCRLAMPRSSSTLAVVCYMLVLLVTLHLVLCSHVCRQARDARHHGWYILLAL